MIETRCYNLNIKYKRVSWGFFWVVNKIWGNFEVHVHPWALPALHYNHKYLGRSQILIIRPQVKYVNLKSRLIPCLTFTSVEIGLIANLPILKQYNHKKYATATNDTISLHLPKSIFKFIQTYRYIFIVSLEHICISSN